MDDFILKMMLPEGGVIRKNDSYERKQYAVARHAARRRVVETQQTPVTVIHFDDETNGSKSSVDGLQFSPSIKVNQNPQPRTQPGTPLLKTLANRNKIGFGFFENELRISMSEPFQMVSIDAGIGNYDNVTVTANGYDSNDAILVSKTFTLGTGGSTIQFENFTGLTTFGIVKTGSSESPHPDAVPTVILVGGRPRPIGVQLFLFLANIIIRLD